MIYEVLGKILPDRVSHALSRLSWDKLREVRLRSDRAVTVWYAENYRYLKDGEVSDSPNGALTVSRSEVEDTVLRACEKSIYAVNDNICRGFLTLRGGIRMGIAGETVFDGDSIRTVKNFTALNIRVPHEIKGCAEKLLPFIKGPRGYYSTLIISPPGAGKTTLLRDMARISSSDRVIQNVLIADERNELSATHDGVPLLDVGVNVDIISGCTKQFAFDRAVRTMRPNIIVTDELCGEADVSAVANTIAGGVEVFASVHADSHLLLKEKESFSELVRGKYFKRYVDLSCMRDIGRVVGVYDENFRELWTGNAI